MRYIPRLARIPVIILFKCNKKAENHMKRVSAIVPGTGKLSNRITNDLLKFARLSI